MQKSIYFHHTKSTKTHNTTQYGTGKNRDFLQKTDISIKTHTTCTRTNPQFSKHLHPTHPKIPCKNNRDFFWNISGNYQQTSENLIKQQRNHFYIVFWAICDTFRKKEPQHAATDQIL